MTAMPRFGFRGRLLLGAVLPALFMVTVLEVVFLNRYHADIERSLIDRGKAIAHQLGAVAEYAIFSGSFVALDMLAKGVCESDDDIDSIHVLDRDGRRLGGSGQITFRAMPLADDLQVVSTPTHMIIQAPIRQAGLLMESEPLWPGGGKAAAAATGHIQVEISRKRIDERNAEMLRITVAILLGGLLLASWISARIAADVMAKLDAAGNELTRQKEAAEALARTDALTGLANRRAFDEALEREIRHALRYDTPLALVVTDIDRFKSINDAYGHHGGDQVLKCFARTLLASVRDVDLVGRWGGEEFVILMPGTNLDEALQAAERMRQAVMEQPARVADGRRCPSTAGFGVAAFSPAEPAVDVLLGHADAALYRAKENGRNRVEAG